MTPEHNRLSKLMDRFSEDVKEICPYVGRIWFYTDLKTGQKNLEVLVETPNNQ